MSLSAEIRWKEELLASDEERRVFVFDCGWGGDPLVVYVPSVEDWHRCVPSWLHDRRDEVIAAMKKTLNHTVREGFCPDYTA
jgi:hypothetical protein